ncbi:MAG: LysE family translocator [Beijerinckiaceae bacterium]|nr:LysE family translocator [Beijerinckiaceae bacterium]
MESHLLLALMSFAFVSSITPGPNNLMLLASGVNFGLMRTLPHMLGIGIGFTLMIVLIGVGLGEVFRRVPALYTVMKYAGGLYMLYLAWKLANAGPVKDGEAGGKPLTFVQAAAFQWVNPKAWVMALVAISTYTTVQDYFTSVVLIAVIFGIVNLPSIGVWALFGVAMKRFLGDPKVVRVFNVAMALLLVASIWPIFAESL